MRGLVNEGSRQKHSDEGRGVARGAPSGAAAAQLLTRPMAFACWGARLLVGLRGVPRTVRAVPLHTQWDTMGHNGRAVSLVNESHESRQ